MSNHYDIFKSLVEEIDKVKLATENTHSLEYLAWRRKFLAVCERVFGKGSPTYKEIDDFYISSTSSYHYQRTMEKLKALLETIIWEREVLDELKIEEQKLRTKEESIKAITGTRKEKIKSTTLENEYFVAHEYVQDKTDDLREAIEEVLKDSGLKPYYADAEVKEGHILLNKILPKIMSTKFGIYEISNPKKPNVFLELGMAIALDKPYYIIVRKGTEIPADLMGLDRIEYGSMKELKEELRKKIKL